MEWVIRKHGMFYRPNAAGYTNDILRAGFFDERTAKAHADDGAGVTAHPVKEFIDQIDTSIAETKAYLAKLQNLRGELS